MRTKRAFFGLLAVAFVIAGAIAIRMRTPGPELQSANFEGIRDGMTLSEVERLLGGPPGDYARPHLLGTETRMSFDAVIIAGAVRHEVWQDDANFFEVYFDADGRVCGRHRKITYERRRIWGF